MADLPELPRSWRPVGVRIAGWALGLMLLLVTTVAWLTFPADVRAAFTLSQRISAISLGLIIWAAFNAVMRSKVIATDEGIEVVNGYRRHHYGWAQIVSVTMPPGAPWATLDLSDGNSVSAIGIQASDGGRARTAIRELRALLEDRHRAS